MKGCNRQSVKEDLRHRFSNDLSTRIPASSLQEQPLHKKRLAILDIIFSLMSACPSKDTDALFLLSGTEMTFKIYYSRVWGK